ncbi:MAG: hypothetical protein MK171_03575 [Pirellulales bacterium]|nr:hypothetical protein [Pirellulales bacterium]
MVAETLTNCTRNQIHNLIVQHGEKTCSKLAKAKQLGIQVLSEANFEGLTSPDNLLF